MIFKSAVHKTLEAETEKCGAVASALITAMYLCPWSFRTVGLKGQHR